MGVTEHGYSNPPVANVVKPKPTLAPPPKSHCACPMHAPASRPAPPRPTPPAPASGNGDHMVRLPCYLEGCAVHFPRNEATPPGTEGCASMATVDPYPDINHMSLNTTGGVCHGHYLISGDTLSAVNTEATPADEGSGFRAYLAVWRAVGWPKRYVQRCVDKVELHDRLEAAGQTGERVYCPTCGQGIGGT